MNTAPREWHEEFSKTLRELGFEEHPQDPCCWVLQHRGQTVGVLATYVDGVITAGTGPIYAQAIKTLRARYNFGKWQLRDGEFVGSELHQKPDGEILLHQKGYTLALKPIKVLDKANEAGLASDDQVAQFGAVLGASGWLSGQSRPDLATQCSLAQQTLPRPTIKDLRHANMALRRARQHDGVALRILPSPAPEVRFVLNTDASLGNAAKGRTQG